MFKRTLPFRIWMILPTVIGLLAVVGFPVGYALYVSLHDYDLTEGGIGDFVRVDNFRAVLDMDVFVEAAKNTVVLTTSVVLIELVVALVSPSCSTNRISGFAASTSPFC